MLTRALFVRSNEVGEVGRFFAVERVLYWGETLALVVAHSRAAGERARDALRVCARDWCARRCQC